MRYLVIILSEDNKLLMPPTIYLIEPAESLLQLNFRDESLRSCVAETKVWQNDESGSELTACQHEAIAKRIILAYFLSFKDFDELIGHPPVSESVFDDFWTLRRLPIFGSLHHLTEYTKTVDKRRFVPTGNEHVDNIVAKIAGFANVSREMPGRGQ